MSLSQNAQRQEDDLLDLLEIPHTVVSGYDGGITGMSAMVCSVLEQYENDFGVVSWPVTIQGTSTPICYTSWTYNIKDGEEGKLHAIEICKKQAEWVAERINSSF